MRAARTAGPDGLAGAAAWSDASVADGTDALETCGMGGNGGRRAASPGSDWRRSIGSVTRAPPPPRCGGTTASRGSRRGRRVAARNVDVQLLVPGPEADKRFVRLAAEDRYRELLDGGARMRSYRPSMPHAEVMTVDGPVRRDRLGRRQPPALERTMRVLRPFM